VTNAGTELLKGKDGCQKVCNIAEFVAEISQIEKGGHRESSNIEKVEHGQYRPAPPSNEAPKFAARTTNLGDY
jgi:hypothetical protein